MIKFFRGNFSDISNQGPGGGFDVSNFWASALNMDSTSKSLIRSLENATEFRFRFWKSFFFLGSHFRGKTIKNLGHFSSSLKTEVFFGGQFTPRAERYLYRLIFWHAPGTLLPRISRPDCYLLTPPLFLSSCHSIFFSHLLINEWSPVSPPSFSKSSNELLFSWQNQPTKVDFFSEA